MKTDFDEGDTRGEQLSSRPGSISSAAITTATAAP